MGTRRQHYKSKFGKIEPLAVSSNEKEKSKEVPPKLTISEELDHFAKIVKNYNQLNINNNSIKNVFKNVKEHIKKVGNITFFSEICGIIGFVFSIATFFYAQNISNKQNAIEKISRENEIYRLTDNGAIYKLLTIKNSDEYKQSTHKEILSHIINTEYIFYQYMALYDFSILENTEPLSDDQIEMAKRYIQDLQDFNNAQNRVNEELIKTIFLIKNSEITSDSLFNKKIELRYDSIMSKGEKVRTCGKNLNSLIESILIARTNKITLTNSINIVTSKIKKDDYFNTIITFYRETIKLLDDTLNHIILNYDINSSNTNKKVGHSLYI